MDQPSAATAELVAEVAAAEATHRGAEEKLAKALAEQRRLHAEDSRARNLTTIWDAIHAMRSALDRLEIPRLIPVAILPFPLTLLWFIMVAELTGALWLAAGTAAMLFLLATGLSVILFVYPDDASVGHEASGASVLRQATKDKLASCGWEVDHARFAVGLAMDRLLKAREKLAEVERARQEEQRQARLAEEAYLRTFEGQCQALLRRPWRQMRADDFEKFLAQVLQTIGYEVQEMGRSGDQGVDIIATKEGRRVAVQAKGYSGNVGNYAVQEVYAGMAHYGCQACAVITNSTFTASAITLAESTRCLLVHAENFEDFVYGRVDLTSSLSGETDSGFE